MGRRRILYCGLTLKAVNCWLHKKSVLVIRACSPMVAVVAKIMESLGKRLPLIPLSVMCSMESDKTLPCALRSFIVNHGRLPFFQKDSFFVLGVYPFLRLKTSPSFLCSTPSGQYSSSKSLNVLIRTQAPQSIHSALCGCFLLLPRYAQFWR